MSLIGQQEIQRIRLRELGFQPKRWQLVLNTVPFLLAAKINEPGFSLSQAKGASE